MAARYATVPGRAAWRARDHGSPGISRAGRADDATTAAWLYLTAYLTDVADGLLARALHVESAAGTRLDGYADISTTVMIDVGIVVRAAFAGVWWIVVARVALVAAGALRSRWVQVHTVLGTAAGGFFRIAIFVFLLVLSDRGAVVPLALVGGVIFAATYVCEARVTLHELHTGERPVR